jgi:hypothetical protein
MRMVNSPLNYRLLQTAANSTQKARFRITARPGFRFMRLLLRAYYKESARSARQQAKSGIAEAVSWQFFEELPLIVRP